ncbi:MAG: 50S ribosomal protein L23 [Candidatus Aenigmarchaeota archaeon]|nr:50S ribosomal protein L23 [Candidatus Aenigmarchaeota archaeon]MDI6722299.1 50S ribosomal protein L23 [Candidatus Aenigmarchaeota archaeon]
MAEDKKVPDKNEGNKNTKAKSEGKKSRMLGILKKEAPAEKKDMPEKEERHFEDPYDIIKFVLMTEKAIRFIETQNRLVFVVDRRSGRKDIKKAVETAFKTKISDVNVLIDQKGRKRAFVKFEKPGEAGEIAIRLGII